MYIFGRTRTAAPAHTRAAMAIAVEAIDRAQQVMGLQFYAWTTLWSPGVGGLLWSTRVQSLEELQSATEKWAADGPTMDWIEQNDHVFEGPTNDVLTEVIHGAPTGEPGPFVTTVQAQWAPGKAAEAVAVGVEISDTFARLTGRSPIFGRSVTGPLAGVGWITSFPDLAAVEAGDAATNADAGWQELLDRASLCYLPGPTVTMLRRLA
jgi:hypothetical protein